MSKRLSDLNEMTPVEDAARRVLALRLEAVRDRIADAMSHGEDRRQHVHALRVASRRAAAAVEVFEHCLPKKVFKEVRQQLRLIRRAVGMARDWDVVLAQLSKGLKHAEPVDQPAYDMLTGYALSHRVPAQRRLEQACPDYPFGFDRLMARTLASVRCRHPEQTTFGGYVRPMLAEMVDGFNTICDRDNGDWGQLHQVRIAGKRLRYSLELVRDCVGESLDTTLSPALVNLQETLGTVNDSFNAAGLLREILGGLDHCQGAVGDRYRGLVERQLQESETLMRSGREEYRRWLQQWRSSAVQQALIALHPDTSSWATVTLGRTA
jgi:CHAD domain-containing protein